MYLTIKKTVITHISNVLKFDNVDFHDVYGLKHTFY